MTHVEWGTTYISESSAWRMTVQLPPSAPFSSLKIALTSDQTHAILQPVITIMHSCTCGDFLSTCLDLQKRTCHHRHDIAREEARLTTTTNRDQSAQCTIRAVLFYEFMQALTNNEPHASRPTSPALPATNGDEQPHFQNQ